MILKVKFPSTAAKGGPELRMVLLIVSNSVFSNKKYPVRALSSEMQAMLPDDWHLLQIHGQRGLNMFKTKSEILEIDLVRI